MTAILQIPLHDFHAEQGARFVDFGGWNMPVQYTGILEEHRAVRQSAGLFDVSHMGEFHVSGADSARFLDRLLVNSISTKAVGKAVYSPMCAEDGGVVDDLIVYRTAEDAFLVCVNASNIEKDFNWFVQQAERWALDVTIQNHSENYALLAVQGPKAEVILQSAGFEFVSRIKKFEHVQSKFLEGEVRICRTGYTGEDGFEIYVSPESAEDLIRLLMDKGGASGMQLCGLGCRDSLRLESGYPLYGHELSETINPSQTDLGFAISLKDREFVGKSAIEEAMQDPDLNVRVGLVLEGKRAAREGALLLVDGEPVGTVTSGTFSPTLQQPIAMGYIKREHAVLGNSLMVDIRGKQTPATLSKLPFYKR